MRDLEAQIQRREKINAQLSDEISKGRDKVERLLQTIEELQASDSGNQLQTRRAERELREEREKGLRLERELEGWKALRLERNSPMTGTAGSGGDNHHNHHHHQNQHQHRLMLGRNAPMSLAALSEAGGVASRSSSFNVTTQLRSSPGRVRPAFAHAASSPGPISNSTSSLTTTPSSTKPSTNPRSGPPRSVVGAAADSASGTAHANANAREVDREGRRSRGQSPSIAVAGTGAGAGNGNGVASSSSSLSLLSPASASASSSAAERDGDADADAGAPAATGAAGPATTARKTTDQGRVAARRASQLVVPPTSSSTERRKTLAKGFL